MVWSTTPFTSHQHTTRRAVEGEEGEEGETFLPLMLQDTRFPLPTIPGLEDRQVGPKDNIILQTP